MLNALLFLVLCTFSLNLTAQNRTESIEIDWQGRHFFQANQKRAFLSFEGAFHDEANYVAPWYQHRRSLGSWGLAQARLVGAAYQDLPAGDWVLPDDLGPEPLIEAHVRLERGRPFLCVSIVPMRRNPQTGRVELLRSAQLETQIQPQSQRRSPRNFVQQSVLAQGQWFRLGVRETGIHRLDAAFFQSLGLDLGQIRPEQIQIFGRSGRMLPEINNASNEDDLYELAIEVEGQADGRFDASDGVLFYAQGPRLWSWSDELGKFIHETHSYSSEISYFLRINHSLGRRIASVGATGTPSYVTDSYDWLGHHELDLVNVMEEAFALPPSGRIWFGEFFRFTRQYDLSFEVPNRLSSEAVLMRASGASRHFSGTGNLNFSLNGQANVLSLVFPSVGSGIYDLYAAYRVRDTLAMVGGGANLSMRVNYVQASNVSTAWLDYVSLQTRAALRFEGGQLAFRDSRAVGQTLVRYRINNPRANMRVWDVSDWRNVSLVTGQVSGGVWEGQLSGERLRELIAFDGAAWRTVQNLGSVANQNLHALEPADLLMVYHRDLAPAALRLAQHRANHSGLGVHLIEVQTIFNEFSGGTADPSAIRDFAKMLYDRSLAGGGDFRYLMLFGSGSFDYRNLRNRPQNSNLVPVYETIESLHPIRTFTTEDYFGLLDDGEGNIETLGGLDLGIGRLPARNLNDAEVMVNKIIAYETSLEHLGDWRNRLTFVADDEDGGVHVQQADSLARHIDRNWPEFLGNKIYLDAFRQRTTSAGSRFPEVNEAIMTDLFRGTLVWTYAGHGGEDGLAQERVFTNTEINALRNRERLALFLTATCSFSPHDDPNIISAGELLLLNPQGGAIAGLTTVRVVFAQDNFVLSDNTLRKIFERFQGRRPTLGEVLSESKNASTRANASNSRKFILLGDPALTLAYPRERVVLTQINGRTVQGLDTLRALDRVRLAGEVRDQNNNLLSDFEGMVQLVVYDKPDNLQTLGNDRTSPIINFSLQNKIIFRGRASVRGGRFEVQFVVPRDINYQFGKGRMMAYAFETGGLRDAHGVNQDFWVGGSSPNASEDRVPPLVKVYMNDEKFVSGGITDENPLLLVLLEDENGINVVGNSVGHDLKAEIQGPDGRFQSYVLNDFYETELDDYQRGRVKYPLKDLPDGLHKVKVEAWDVYNNVGYGFVDFVVSRSAKLALERVLNYPNPFTTSTRFQFEHNFAGRSLEVLVSIYTVSGKLVKSIRHQTLARGYRVDDIHWDGRDEFGQDLAKGVYVYQVTLRVEGEENRKEWRSAYQKLVILK